MSTGVIVLWIVLVLSIVAVVYPYLLYPLILRLLPASLIAKATSGGSDGSDFALLFCAYNESASIDEKIDNLRDLRRAFPGLEILAYDDCSSDGTADRLAESNVGIRLVRGTERLGKAHGMKLLASMTDRRFLIFTDANVILLPESVNELYRCYADPSVGGVCGYLEYVGADGTAAAHAGGLYWRLEEIIKSLESRSGNVLGGDGSIFSIRRELYPDFPDTVLDDLTVSMEAVFRGQRLIKDPSVVARERLVAARNDDVRRRMRIAIRSFHTHMTFRHRIRSMAMADRWRYWSHRYLRWHGAFFLLTGLLSGLALLWLTLGWQVACAAVACVVVLWLAGTYLRLGLLSSIVHMAASIVITGVAVVRARRGETMATWQPPSR